MLASQLTFRYHLKSSPYGRTLVTFSRVALNCSPNFCHACKKRKRDKEPPVVHVYMYMLHCLVCCSDTYHHVGVSRFNCAFKYIQYIPPTDMLKIFSGINAGFLADELKTHSSYCLESSLNIHNVFIICAVFSLFRYDNTQLR